MLKALLILVNASGRLSHLRDLHPNILLVFLPNTTSLLQLLDQGVIPGFSITYLQQTLMYLLKVIDKPHKSLMHEFFSRAATCP